MRQQFRKWHSPLPPRTQLYRYTRAHDAGITNALGDCFLSTVFSSSLPPFLPLSVPVLTIYRHPASSRKLFRQAFKACLVSPVVTLTSKRRLHFLFSISRRRVPRDAFDADSTGIRGGNAKFTSIVDGCALLKWWLERISIHAVKNNR